MPSFVVSVPEMLGFLSHHVTAGITAKLSEDLGSSSCSSHISVSLPFFQLPQRKAKRGNDLTDRKLRVSGCSGLSLISQ